MPARSGILVALVAAALIVLVPAASSKPATKLPPRLLVHVKARIRVYFNPAHPKNSASGWRDFRTSTSLEAYKSPEASPAEMKMRTCHQFSGSEDISY